MPWPTVAVATGDVVTATQLNLLPIQIADSTLGASAASFDFTSLPSQFAHLRVVAQLRGDQVALTNQIIVRVNNDSAANYDTEIYFAQAAGAPTAAAAIAQTSWNQFYMPGATATASYPGYLVLDFPAYAATTFFKSVCASNGYLGTTGSTTFQAASCWWRSTAAINRITIAPASGNLIAGSRVTLYGFA